MSDTLVVKIGNAEVGRVKLPESGELLSSIAAVFAPEREFVLVLDPVVIARAVARDLPRVLRGTGEQP